jgi:hypothetical protein
MHQRGEAFMAQHPPPDELGLDDLHIETPVIDIQDLEHKPGPDTRVSNKGVKTTKA